MARTSKNRTATLVLSMEPETKERLRAYADQNHTSISQAITDWIWKQPVRAGQPDPGSTAAQPRQRYNPTRGRQKKTEG